LWVISMISSQMGISLRNSYLFRELGARTAELAQRNEELEVRAQRKEYCI
jgi:hypothetical protein